MTINQDPAVMILMTRQLRVSIADISCVGVDDSIGAYCPAVAVAASTAAVVDYWWGVDWGFFSIS